MRAIVVVVAIFAAPAVALPSQNDAWIEQNDQPNNVWVEETIPVSYYGNDRTPGNTPLSNIATLSKTGTKPNMQDGLVPPEGTAWRGSSHWAPTVAGLDDNGKYDPNDFANEFGVPLHIFRSFKSEHAFIIQDGEKEFVDKGGILWYGFQPRDWAEAATDDWASSTLKKYADAIKSLAPAKVLVARGWEPDGHAAPYATGAAKFGTVQDYQAFCANVKKWFDTWEVDNAVYVIDYSHSAAFDEDIRSLLSPLYPTDGSNSWAFFNMFQSTSQAKYDKNKGKKAQPDPNAANVIDFFYDYFSNNMPDQIQQVPWGLGAWGTNSDTNAPIPWAVPIPLSDREKFINDAGTAFTSGKYPKLRASIYFDSLSSIITPYTEKITSVSDLAHGNVVTTYKNSNDMVPTYKNFLELQCFTANDAQMG